MAAAHKDESDGGEGGADPAFGATIATLQAQLREVTEAKDEAVAAAAAAAQMSGGEGGHSGGVPVSDAQKQVKELEETLAEKQSQNEQLLKKVRQLPNACRSLQEQAGNSSGGATAAPAPPAGAAGDAAAGFISEEEAQKLRAQLEQTQDENQKLMARLRAAAQRFRELKSEGLPPPSPTSANDDASDNADDVRVADAERRVSAAEERTVELTRRCEEAEAEHERAVRSLKEAAERVTELEAAAAAASAAAAADQAGLSSQEELRAENANLEEKVTRLADELQSSRQAKEEVSTLLEAKNADLEKVVRVVDLLRANARV